MCNIFFYFSSSDIPELIVLKTTAPELKDKDFKTVYFTRCEPNWSIETDVVYIILRTLILYAVPLIFMSFAYYQIVRVLWSTDSIPGARRETPVHLHSNGNGISHHLENGNGQCAAQRKRKNKLPSHLFLENKLQEYAHHTYLSCPQSAYDILFKTAHKLFLLLSYKSKCEVGSRKPHARSYVR